MCSACAEAQRSKGQAQQGAGAARGRCGEGILRDKFGGREMAKVLSLVMTVFSTAPVLAPALGQGLMLLTHWRVIFVFFVVFFVLVFSEYYVSRSSSYGRSSSSAVYFSYVICLL